MTKKIYLGIGVLVLAILVIGGIYWQSQKVAVSPVEKELTAEEESLSQDSGALEEMGQETGLENLEQDLTEIAGEKPVIETVSIENLESELNSELNSFSADLSELEGFESDASLDNLDTGLAGIE